MADYSEIDTSPALSHIFYPRRDFAACPANAFDLAVPVDGAAFVSCRFYMGDKTWPWILFFHGNGEVVSDYDNIAPFYKKNGLNLVVADYRGYGASTGMPTLTGLFKDAHTIFENIKEEIKNRGFNTSLWIMGRSLGSLSVVEIARHYGHEVRGLIIESGFANILRILIHLDLLTYNIDVESIDKESLDVLEKISIPTLIIHGEEDTLVPLREAETIYNHIGTKKKQLVVIPGADHNDIMFVGLERYFRAIGQFVRQGLE